VIDKRCLQAVIVHLDENIDNIVTMIKQEKKEKNEKRKKMILREKNDICKRDLHYNYT